MNHDWKKHWSLVYVNVLVCWVDIQLQISRESCWWKLVRRTILFPKPEEAWVMLKVIIFHQHHSLKCQGVNLCGKKHKPKNLFPPVDGTNPAPPWMYKNPVNNVIIYLSIGPKTPLAITVTSPSPLESQPGKSDLQVVVHCLLHLPGPIRVYRDMSFVTYASYA